MVKQQGNGKVTVKRVFGSLVNNATAIDGAKYSPWWVGLILFVLGLILPVLPLFVSAATTDGTSFMSACEYGLGLDKTFGEAMKNIDGTLTFDNTTKTISYNGTADSEMIGSYVSSAGETNGQYELRIFFANAIDEDAAIKFIADKESVSYKKGTTTVAGSNEENTYIPSSIYFFNNTFGIDIYASNSTERKAILNSLADLTCLDYDKGDLKEYFIGNSFDKTNKDNRLAALDNLKTFINTTYETTKSRQMWLGSLIYIGIYAAMNVFMILMIFLMSRGKNNPNNCLNLWHCTKIDWWTCFCPGLLGMIFGFIFSGSAVMLYVMFLAMRTMWLTMREMRPQY